MFKSLIASLAVATCTFGAIQAPSAKAADCVFGNGFQMCFQIIGRNGAYTRWNVQLRNNHIVENMTVDCYGKSLDQWASRGGASKSEARYMAKYFCSI